MKANILGFWLEAAGPISLQDLFTHLKGMNGTEEKFGGYERLIFIEETEKYFTGLFLTSKNHKKFCELLRDGKQLTINVRQVQKGASLIDFNFFVVQKETGRGLYQYYHNSCRCPMFVKFCATEFQSLMEDRRDKEIAVGGKDLSNQDREKIEKKYGHSMNCGILVRPEAFAALVRKFKSIARFEFSLNTVVAEKEQRYRGFQGISKRIKHCITFNREADLISRIKAIMGFVNSDNDIGDASVAGMGVDGLDKTISLFDNPDSFGSYEFDKLAENMDFEPKDFAASVFMHEMIRVGDAHDHVLGKAAK